MDIQNRKIGILGIAKSGLAAAEKIKQLGGIPFLSEINNESEIENVQRIKDNFLCEFGRHSDKILESEFIIVSPGIPLNITILKRAEKKGIKLISEIEFGYLIKHPASRIIAVTGSNGKSTTVSLIHHLLETAGYKSILAGNIGTAFTSFPIEKQGIDFIVLEISSFQLDLIETFKPEVGVILNITPDHLNRYQTFEDYARSKFRIFKNQNSNDLAILNLDDEVISGFPKNIRSKIRNFSSSKKSDIYFDGNNIRSGDKNFPIKDFSLKGPHNISNIMASILAISPFEIFDKILQNALRTFTPLPHRLEFVAEINGIKFYNDSKATNTDSVKYALQSFDKPVRIILGGSDKGEDFSTLNRVLKKNAKKVYLIGETQKKMFATFGNLKKTSQFDDFKKCVQTAFSESENGDIILLSPACASFDMFNNFEDRGNVFKKIVLEMKNEK